MKPPAGRLARGAVVVTVLLGAQSEARADDSTPTVEQQAGRVPATRSDAVPEPVAERWYGWQTLIPDVAAIGLFVGAAEARSGALAGVSMGTFALGGPVVHAAHGHGGKALGSFGLRLGLPLVGAGIGLAAGLGKGENCRIDGGCPFIQMIVGALVGAGAAMATDASLLAFERVPKPGSAPAHVPVSFSPTASVGPHRLTLGAVGSF